MQFFLFISVMTLDFRISKYEPGDGCKRIATDKPDFFQSVKGKNTLLVM